MGNIPSSCTDLIQAPIQMTLDSSPDKRELQSRAAWTESAKGALIVLNDCTPSYKNEGSRWLPSSIYFS